MMTTDDKHRLLSNYMSKFRAWSYAELLARLAAQTVTLETADGIYRDGTDYQIEIEAFWDDNARRNIRVAGDLCASPQVATPDGGFGSDVCESFIMQPDGRFVVD